MIPRLTPNEEKVLRLIAEGFQDKEIADRLGKGIQTIVTQRASIYSKCRASGGLSGNVVSVLLNFYDFVEKKREGGQ